MTQLNTIETQMNYPREDSSQKDETRKELEEAKTIECATCNEKFVSIEKLIKHVMEIECVNCNKKCKSVEKLMEHTSERECDKGGRWTCCGTYLKEQKKDSNEMAKEEDTEIYITQIDCLECKEGFKSQEELVEHMEKIMNVITVGNGSVVVHT